MGHIMGENIDVMLAHDKHLSDQKKQKTHLTTKMIN